MFARCWIRVAKWVTVNLAAVGTVKDQYKELPTKQNETVPISLIRPGDALLIYALWT